MVDIDLTIPEEPHEIFEDAYHLYASIPGSFGPEELAQLGAKLDAIFPDLQEAYYAVYFLGAYGHYLASEGDKASYDGILGLIRAVAPRFEPVSHQAAELMGAGMADAEKALAKLAGSAPKRAPKVGEKAPEGSLKATDFIPNPALMRPGGRR